MQTIPYQPLFLDLWNCIPTKAQKEREICTILKGYSKYATYFCAADTKYATHFSTDLKFINFYHNPTFKWRIKIGCIFRLTLYYFSTVWTFSYLAMCPTLSFILSRKNEWKKEPKQDPTKTPRHNSYPWAHINSNFCGLEVLLLYNCRQHAARNDGGMSYA